MKRVKLLDYEIDTFKFEEAVNYAGELLKNDKVNQVVTINPEMFETAHKDEEFSQILKEAEMVIPDGIGVKLGLKIMGENVTRIAGVDFARRMIDYATAEGYPVALIGAKSEILEKAMLNLESEVEHFG